MENLKLKHADLLILDIDNTVFNWVSYYTHSLFAMTEFVAKKTDLSTELLFAEMREVFTKEGSIEYPFVLQKLDSLVKMFHSKEKLFLEKIVEPARRVFLNTAKAYLCPYEGVSETLEALQKKRPQLKIAALTDCPRYVAMWKLNKLGLLNYFSSIYGLSDPALPIDKTYRKVLVSEEILFKHLSREAFNFQGHYRTLPDDYEKPGLRGLMTIIMDHGFDLTQKSSYQGISWLGDNLKKDIPLGLKMGLNTIWAKYGSRYTEQEQELLLKFSPKENLSKNMSLEANFSGQAPQGFRSVESFRELPKMLS